MGTANAQRLLNYLTTLAQFVRGPLAAPADREDLAARIRQVRAAVTWPSDPTASSQCCRSSTSRKATLRTTALARP